MNFSPDQVFGAMPPGSLALVEAVLAEAGRARVAVYLVGGPVRDLALDHPIRDVDLIVVPRPGSTVEALARGAAPPGSQVDVHDRFGTATVSTADGSVDLATVRREVYRHPGALPKVEPGTLEEDLHRRDFSVNAMAIRLRRARGRGSEPLELIDPEGGLADLAARRLRILHERSFSDDPTRALRAARLGPRLGFRLSRSSLAQLQGALRDGVFGSVSGDRLRREIEKLFDDAARGLDPARALRKLVDWHVLPALEPGLELPRDAVGPVRRLGRSLAAPPWRGQRWRGWVAGLSVWLAPLPAGLRRRTLTRLSVRGELKKRIAAFPDQGLALVPRLLEARGRGTVDTLLRGLDEEVLYALHACSPTPARRRIVRWAAEDRARRALINGLDLAGIGLEGPAIGQALARIREAQLDGAVANREEALALAREVGRRTAVPRARRGRPAAAPRRGGSARESPPGRPKRGG